MKIIILPRFEREYKKLSTEIKVLAEKRIGIFLDDPFDSRLKTHKLSGVFEGYMSFSVDHAYRIIFTFDKDEMVRFYRIGDHSIYE
jgi:addiction module RelE/StbE family toxin